MKPVKGIIFDYGGTIDTNGVHWGELIIEQYREAGIPIKENMLRDAYVHGERMLAKNPIIKQEDTFLSLLRKKMRLQFEYLAEHTDLDCICEEKAMEIAGKCYQKVLDTMETTIPVIDSLHRLYRMVLVTNFYGNMHTVLEEFGLSDYFCNIIESSVEGIRKPDPALFSLGIERLGTEANETLVIGDSYRKDIYPAGTLGCTTAWLKNRCWEEEAVVPGHEPGFIIDSLEKLPDIVERIK